MAASQSRTQRSVRNKAELVPVDFKPPLGILIDVERGLRREQWHHWWPKAIGKKCVTLPPSVRMAPTCNTSPLRLEVVSALNKYFQPGLLP